MSELLAWIPFRGTEVFAISCALKGLRHQMDIVGVAFVATLTGIGGGTVRDVLLNAGPLLWVGGLPEHGHLIALTSVRNEPVHLHRHSSPARNDFRQCRMFVALFDEEMTCCTNDCSSAPVKSQLVRRSIHSERLPQGPEVIDNGVMAIPPSQLQKIDQMKDLSR